MTGRPDVHYVGDFTNIYFTSYFNFRELLISCVEGRPGIKACWVHMYKHILYKRLQAVTSEA